MIDELVALVPPPAAPDPAEVAGVPDDYRALLRRYGLGNLAGARLLIPQDEAERQRSALRALIEEGIEQPYAPDELLPWAIDEAGNVLWWLMQGGWPVVANEARGEAWQRFDGGAVAFLVALLSGKVTSDFLTIEGDDFTPY